MAGTAGLAVGVAEQQKKGLLMFSQTKSAAELC